ncbi:hypothetical protein ACVI1I_006298 [Bradyrhizobium sp. USDA 4459]
MHDGIDLLGIARGHRDGVRTLEVAIHLVMTGEAITSAEQERREQSQIPDGHLSLALVEGFHDGWSATVAAGAGRGALTSGAMMCPYGPFTSPPELT